MSAIDTIYNVARSDGMPVHISKYIVAQSGHETGLWRHRFFTDGNNAFGYSYTENSKYQIGAGDKADNLQSIGVYRNVDDSTREITDWIKRRQKEGKFPKDLNSIKSIKDYATYLKNSGYYTDSIDKYSTGMLRVYNQLSGKIGFDYFRMLLIYFVIIFTAYYLING